MAAPAPLHPVQPQHTVNPMYSGPGEAALQRGADQILALIEHEKHNAVRQRDAEIAHLRSQLQNVYDHLEALKVHSDTTQRQHEREKQAASEELQQALKHTTPSGLQSTVDALLKERDALREDHSSSLSAATAAAEGMGIHSAGHGLYKFSAQWAELFNELGIAGGIPWRPDQLLAVVASTAERLRLHRGDAPQHAHHLSPNLDDPFVIEVELSRARQYVSRLEGKQAEIQSKQQTLPSHHTGLPTPPGPPVAH